MADLQARFLRYLRHRDLVRAGDRVLVAVSGGVDSVVLLHLFRSVTGELDLALNAAHFDHAMRPDSEADADWVSGLCRAWEVPLARARAGRPLHGETDARQERYRFLQSASRQCGAARIATAHHADDQVETVLFRILRGTGLRGLAGIPVRRGRIIRPLLRFTRRQLLDYAAEHGIRYREDATNAQPGYARNRIRRNVIPALETVRPHAAASVRALARYAARTEAAWQSALKEVERHATIAADERVIELARPVLLEYHPELRARMLRQMLRRHGVVAGRAQTASIAAFCERADSGATLMAGRSLRIERAFDTIRVVRSTIEAGRGASVTIAGVSGHATLDLGGRCFAIDWETDDLRRPDAEHFATDISEAPLVLRAWEPGDRIRLAYGSKKLKKLFAERRIPASERARIPILADAAGRVLWIIGVVRSIDAGPEVTGPALNIMVSNAEHA